MLRRYFTIFLVFGVWLQISALEPKTLEFLKMNWPKFAQKGPKNETIGILKKTESLNVYFFLDTLKVIMKMKLF